MLTIDYNVIQNRLKGGVLLNKCKDKKEIIALYEKLAKNYYIETNSMELTLYYLEKLKLKDEDYEKIIEQIENKQKYKICTTETEKIIKLLSKKLNNYTLEYNSNDVEPVIYFHLDNNITYLINYDSIECKWYISLIETLSSNLIKEIHNNTFDNFINYLKNNDFN